MDKNLNAKQPIKKSQMAVEKIKKSASKKKKKNKKSTSKSDQSPDSLEVEGIGSFEQAGQYFLRLVFCLHSKARTFVKRKAILF